MADGNVSSQKIDGTLSLSVAFLCAMFLVLTFVCFILVSVWLSVQQYTLRFERKVSEVSVATVQLYHATNAYRRFIPIGAGRAEPASEEASARRKEFLAAVQKFTEKSDRVKGLFRVSNAEPELKNTIAYLIWLSGATRIPADVRAIWEDRSAGSTLSQMMVELKKTCLYLCEGPKLTSRERDQALLRLNDLTVRRLQPQLGRLLNATVQWQTENVEATRRTIAIAFVTLMIAVVVVWRGLVAPLLRRIAAAKMQMARQNAELERRVLERTESLSAALEIAKDAAESRSNFLANMSHELRTPMNGVLGMAALLSTTKLNDQQRVHVETITKSGTLLLRIIDDVLDMSGLAAGKLKITRTPAVLAEIVGDAVKLLQPVAAAKHLKLELDFSKAAHVSVLVDPERLSQVLNNLIGNALKFTEAGEVCVSLKEAETAEGVLASISILDTGIGIPDAELTRIFDQFERVRNGKVISGAGLGLAISRSLVQEMGGRLHVTSTVGEGSEFTVTLPLDHAREQPRAVTDQHVATY